MPGAGCVTMPMTGRKAHIARLKRLSGGSVERDIGKALFAGGDRIRVAAQISLTTGAVSGKFHVPSTAPAPPNQDTGVLGNNIENVQINPLLVEVSSNASYSAALELGTSRMQPRPFMAPARDAERGNVERLVVEAVKRAAKRSS
jgi:HK97 gp10 family phage protein